MSHTGVNVAVTTEGEPYNKLRRPDHLPGPPASTPPKTSTRTSMPTAGPDKRKREDGYAQDRDSDDEMHVKRPKIYSGPKKSANKGKSRQPKQVAGRLPVSDDERSSDDEVTVQARAFLRQTR